MCAQVAPSGEYLRGHGRVVVDVTALRRLWQHLPVLGLVVLACVPVCAVVRDSLLCNSCGLSAVKINEELLLYFSVVLKFGVLELPHHETRCMLHSTSTTEWNAVL